MTTKAEFAAGIVQRQLFSQRREFFAHFDISKVEDALVSFLQLNVTADELREAATGGKYGKMLVETIVTLLDRRSIVPLAELNAAAQADLDAMRKESGVGLELIQPPAPAPLTADQLLDQEVRNDYATLPGSKMMAKRRGNKAYETKYQQIAGTLGSAVTTVHDLGGNRG